MSVIKYSLCFLWLCVWLLVISISGTCASIPTEIKETFPLLKLDNSLSVSTEPSSEVELIHSPYNQQPTGVGITYQLDPDKRYLVSITGQFNKRRPQLGVRIAGIPDRILAAPDGKIFINIFNTPEATLFLNIHPKMKYRLHSIHFRECPECIDRTELIQIIDRANPELEALLKQNHLLAAQTLLDWTANITPLALSKSFFDKTKNLSRMTPEEIYNLFNLNIAGVYCGGAALFLNKILTLFEIDSFTLDFGDSKSLLTHTTVVVAEHSDNDWKYYVFDPTFNFTLHNPDNGYFLSFRELLDLPPADIGNKTNIRQHSLDSRRFLALKKDAKLCSKIRTITPNYLVCHSPDYTLKRYLNNMNPVFIKSGYARNLPGFVQLLKNRVFLIGGLSNQNSREQFIKLLKAHKIPLGNNT